MSPPSASPDATFRAAESILAEASARAAALRAAAAQAARHADALARQRDAAAADLADRKAALALLQWASGRLAESAEKAVAGLATEGLRDVFGDHLRLEIRHGASRGQPTAELILHDDEAGHCGRPSESFGGGPGDVLGILLRVLAVWRRPALARVLVLDEPTSHLSGGYAEAASAMLRRLCDPAEKGGLGFTMLCVTHSPALAASAHRHYRAESRGGELVLEREK